MGWCDDIRSKDYNKLIRFPFPWRAEKLYRSDNTYNIVVVLDYNMKPIVKGKGSAIFIHLSKNNYSPTLGCISLNLKDLYLLLRLVKKSILENKLTSLSKYCTPNSYKSRIMF